MFCGCIKKQSENKVSINQTFTLPSYQYVGTKMNSIIDTLKIFFKFDIKKKIVEAGINKSYDCAEKITRIKCYSSSQQIKIILASLGTCENKCFESNATLALLKDFSNNSCHDTIKSTINVAHL